MTIKEAINAMLPCPFCGVKPIIDPWHGGGPQKKRISCDNDACQVAPAVCGETTKLAVEYWNTREDAYRVELAGAIRS